MYFTDDFRLSLLTFLTEKASNNFDLRQTKEYSTHFPRSYLTFPTEYFPDDFDGYSIQFQWKFKTISKELSEVSYGGFQTKTPRNSFKNIWSFHCNRIEYPSKVRWNCLGFLYQSYGMSTKTIWILLRWKHQETLIKSSETFLVVIWNLSWHRLGPPLVEVLGYSVKIILNFCNNRVRWSRLKF